jgi:hypothetical protein
MRATQSLTPTDEVNRRINNEHYGSAHDLVRTIGTTMSSIRVTNGSQFGVAVHRLG